MIERNPIELVLVVLVVAIALAHPARRLGIAYPILDLEALRSGA